MRKILIDADVLVYWCSFACQKMRYRYEGIEFEDHAKLREYLATKDLKPKEVEYEKYLDVLEEDIVDVVAQRAIDMIMDTCESDDLEFYLSGPTNFRTEIATLQPYKGNRNSEKPVHFEYAKHWFSTIATATSVDEEADDLLAQRQHELGYEGVIASIDKDLNMIPGRHFNWDKMLKYNVKPDDGDRWFWTQMLTGDKADNIPGINRCGPKTAEKILAECTGVDDRLEAVKRKYQKQYGDLWESAMNEVGQLLWMRRLPNQMWTIDNHKEVSGL